MSNLYTTLFAPEDKNLPGFKAIKWMINNSTSFRDEIVNAEENEQEYWTTCHSCDREFKGTIPYRMYQDICDLARKGYTNRESGFVVLINWFSDEGRKHHTVKCKFGEYNSNANNARLFYETSHYDQPIDYLLFPEA